MPKATENLAVPSAVESQSVEARAKATTTPDVKARVVENKILAANLRARLTNGYPPSSTFVSIVNQLDDRQLIRRYLQHERTTKKQPEGE